MTASFVIKLLTAARSSLGLPQLVIKYHHQ